MLESDTASLLLIADEFIDLSSVGGCWIEWKEICSGLFTGGREMETQVFTFAASRFVPVAIGFFGLGIGYFIWGGQALFGFPKPSPEVNRTMGIWGFWMPGFMQFITGVYLLIGLTWFNVFGEVAPYIYGRSGLHGLRHPLVCYGSSPLHRCERRAGWLDGDRVPIHQHSGGRRFPACG
jgi:hypothetical protein